MRWFVAVFASLAAFVPAPCAFAASGGSADWLAISDIHLNPFDASAVDAPAGNDTNPALLRSALRAMRAADPNPALVVIPGDFFAHRFARLVAVAEPGTTPSDAAIATMRTIAMEFQRAFPRAQFAIAMGNNDAPCGDYATDLGGRFLAAAAMAWAPLVNRHGSAPRFERDFVRGAHYTIDLAGGHTRLIVANTVVFSKQYRGTCSGDDAAAPARELAWLHAALRTTPAGSTAVIVMHIPPGYDAFATDLAHGSVGWPYLHGPQNAALTRALAVSSSGVRFAIAGHAHRFDFRIFGHVPLIVLGSLSPVYGNSPTFYRFAVERDGGLDDLFAYARNRHTRRWHAARAFDARWNISRIDASALRALHERLQRHPEMRRAWEAQSVGWTTVGSGPLALWNGPLWRTAWCAQTLFDDRFLYCSGVDRRFRIVLTAAIVFAIAAGAALIAGIAVIVASRKPNRRLRF